MNANVRVHSAKLKEKRYERYFLFFHDASHFTEFGLSMISTGAAERVNGTPTKTQVTHHTIS